MTDVDAPTAVTLPNGIKLHSCHTCFTTGWFSPTCSHKIRFLVVDMKLPFVLGMEQLRQAAAQLDLQAGTLTLKGDDGYPITVKGSSQPSMVLSAEMLACMSLYENAPLDSVFMCSAKQVKKLVRNPEMEVFAALATDK